jgi:hypothetical protein
MVIFHSYVSLPEGIMDVHPLKHGDWNGLDTSQLIFCLCFILGDPKRDGYGDTQETTV